MLTRGHCSEKWRKKRNGGILAVIARKRISVGVWEWTASLFYTVWVRAERQGYKVILYSLTLFPSFMSTLGHSYEYTSALGWASHGYILKTPWTFAHCSMMLCHVLEIRRDFFGGNTTSYNHVFSIHAIRLRDHVVIIDPHSKHNTCTLTELQKDLLLKI